MISKETLECVEVGILTDEQLDEAIKHYSELEKNLQCHGAKYALVWRDAFQTLNTLIGYKQSRKKDKKKPNENEPLTFKVTVEYTCKNMISGNVLNKDFNSSAMLAYKFISNNFKDSPYNFSSSQKVISVEIA